MRSIGVARGCRCTPQGEKKSGGEFMGLSCKCPPPPEGESAALKLGGISWSPKDEKRSSAFQATTVHPSKNPSYAYDEK